ncbi:MAG: hypothetical protein GX945_07465 [Lentisphaerae bacterium]|nr:hypothetical protein [Lentisphaerota bacterium]
MAKRHAYHKKLLALLVTCCVLLLLLGRCFAGMTTMQDGSAQPAVMQSTAALPAIRPLGEAPPTIAKTTPPHDAHTPNDPTSPAATTPSEESAKVQQLWTMTLPELLNVDRTLAFNMRCNNFWVL